MPKKKERAAGYIRESNEALLDSATIDSQAKAVRQYCEREGYIYEPQHEYREAKSAYVVSYLEREILLGALAAAKRHEFDVFVVSELRALGRRQVEIFVLYDMLQKCGVRLETISEKFEDSAIGRYILSTRAMIAEVERENTYARLQRGRLHRLEAGNINGHNKPAYGYVFIDTPREAKAAYALNTLVFTVNGKEWTEVKVVTWIYDRAVEGWSVRRIALTLTQWGIPVPGNNRRTQKPLAHVWHPSTVHAILTSTIYTGRVIAQRYRNIENGTTKKRNIIKRPQEDWKVLENVAPAIVTTEVFDEVQMRLAANKLDSLRRTNPDTPKEELGLLRGGFCKCGICGHTMTVVRRGINGPQYYCKQRLGKNDHITCISQRGLDRDALEKIREVVRDPNIVRQKVEQRRAVPKPTIDPADIEVTVAKLQEEYDNLFELARHATNDKTRQRLGMELEALEKKQRDTEALLIHLDESQEDLAKLEAEIMRFEKWAASVREGFEQPTSYEELRFAVHILGLHAVVFPKHGDYPFRCQIEADPPAIMKHLSSNPKLDCLPPCPSGPQRPRH